MSQKYNEIETQKSVPIQESAQSTEKVKVKPKRVVKEKKQQYKPNLGRRVLNALAPEEGYKAFGAHIYQDIILPAIKDSLYGAITNTAQSFIYKSTGVIPTNNPYGRRPSTRSGYTSYASQYKGIGQVSLSQSREVHTNRYGFKQPILTYDEAREIVGQLQYLIQENGEATIADYYDLIGEDGQYTDEYYGWRDLTGYRIVSVRGGSIIELPPSITLE